MSEDPILDAPFDSMSDQSVSVSTEIKDYLHTTAKWGKFLAVVGFVITGMIVVASLSIGLLFGTMGSMMIPGMPDSGLLGVGLGLLYALLAVVYFFPAWYLFQFSTKMMVAVRNDDQEFFTIGFKNMKSLFRFLGIATLVLLSLYPIMIICVLIFGAAMAGGQIGQ
jgi:hypothetical protein